MDSKKYFTNINDKYFVQDETATKNIETIQKKFVIIEPSNDETGAQDLTNIQNALNTYKVVYLTSGTYYLNNSLKFGVGYELHGVSQVETKILILNDTSFIDLNETATDHICVENMFIQSQSGNKNSNCLNLLGSMTSPYNGAPYSYFNNLWIDNFDIAIAYSGGWSSVFNRIRCSANNISVKCNGTCNNLSFIDCEFMQGKQGIVLNPNGGSELYGIRVYRCNFEGNTTECINASGVIGLTIEDIYSENTVRLITINSCPNFIINGGQISGAQLIGSVEASAFSSNVFKNPKFSITNLNVMCSINEARDLMYIGSGITCSIMKNIRVLNRGTGQVKVLPSISSIAYKIQERTWFNQDTTPNFYAQVEASRDREETVFISSCYFIVSQAFIPKSSGRISLRARSTIPGDWTTIGYINLNASQQYNVGQYLPFTLTSSFPAKGQQQFTFVQETDLGVNVKADITIVTQTGNLFEQISLV